MSRESAFVLYCTFGHRLTHKAPVPNATFPDDELIGRGTMWSLRAEPGWAPWGKGWPPGAHQHAPPSGLVSNGGPCKPCLGERTQGPFVSFIIGVFGQCVV